MPGGARRAARPPAGECALLGGLYASSAEACCCSSCSSSSGNGTVASAGSASSCEYGRAASPLADRQLLLELSRTLSAVLEGNDSARTDREILRDISRSVAQRAPGQPRPAPIYEEIRPCGGGGEAGASPTIGLVNPINSSLYQQRCRCARTSFLCQSQPSSPPPPPLSAQRVAAKPDDRIGGSTPTVFLLAADRSKSSAQALHETSCSSCNCMNYYLAACDVTPGKLGSSDALPKSYRSQSGSRADNNVRLNYPSVTPHDYTTLECSSDSSSSEAGAVSKDDTWSNDFRGFDKNLDFTLDGFKAERLRRAIAKAKRKRQWCRVLVVIFGLVFFILSVVIVSLSVTKGRKVFGSM